MKSNSTTRVLAASTLFAGLLAGCASSTQGDQGGYGASQGSTGAQGGMGTSPTSAECAQFHQLESQRTPSTQQELVDPTRGMSPEQRERHMNMMRERCGPRPSSAPPNY